MKTPPYRDPERGTVVILVAVLWTAMFGFAALAVDAGYLYQSQRSLQATADAAVLAGLPALVSGSTTQASANAKSIATASGYASSAVTATTTSTQLTVSISVVQPRFFAGVLGFHTKTLTATASGKINPPLPAVFAGGSTCPGSGTTGLQFNGNGFAITGNVQSNSAVNYYTGGSNTTNGSVTYNSACGYSAGSGNPAPTGGSSNTGGSLPYPLSQTINSFPACTFGSLTTSGDLSLGSPGAWWATGGPSGGTLVSGVYCAKGNISLGANTVSGTVTFVATGTITIGSSTANLTAYSQGILGFTTATQNCAGSPGPAVNVGNSSVTLNGTFDAPNGCINVGGSSITINGSLIGNEVQIGVGGSSVINSTGGGSGSYYLYQ